MASDTSDTNTPEMTAAQKAMLKKLTKVMPEAKLFEPRAGGSYYGPIVASDKNFVMQQVGDNTVVAHPKGDLSLPADMKLKVGQVINVAHSKANEVTPGVPTATLEMADPSRWQERAARTPASIEHAALAKNALGDRVGVFNAPSADKGLSPSYEGVIAVVTDEHIIQRINSRAAIVHHVGADVARDFGAGQEAVIRYDNGRFKDAQAVERSTEQAPDRAQRGRTDPDRTPDDKARAASWVLAKNLVKKSHGEDLKLYSAKRVDAEAGRFRGPIVAMTDHHVIQRVGTSNTFVAHSRDDLQGELQTGRFAQINYAQGKAQSQLIERNQDRKRGQGRAEHEPRHRSADRGRPAQGMSL